MARWPSQVWEKEHKTCRAPLMSILGLSPIIYSVLKWRLPWFEEWGDVVISFSTSSAFLNTNGFGLPKDVYSRGLSWILQVCIQTQSCKTELNIWGKNIILIMRLKTSLVFPKRCSVSYGRSVLDFGYYLLKIDSNAILKAPMPRRSVGNAVCLKFTMHQYPI